MQCNPSTLSAGIKDIEKVLGAALAERDKRNVLLTQVGLEVAHRGRMLLRNAEGIVDVAAQHEPMSGEIQLGLIPTISPFLLPRVIPDLKQQYPNLSMRLYEEQTDSLLHQLRSGKIDAVLMAIPFDMGDLQYEFVYKDHFVFACSPNHPLANEPGISSEMLANQEIMLLSEGHCLRKHALDACKFTESDLRSQFEATSLLTLIQMVSAGMGATLLPSVAANSHVVRGTNIKMIPLQTTESREIVMVWRKNYSRQSDCRTIANVLCNSFANV